MQVNSRPTAHDSRPGRGARPVGGASPRPSPGEARPYHDGMGDYHPAVEEYLETILELEESGIPPLRARIVERLGVSAPAVSETVKRLEREGYLTLDQAPGSGRIMHLTASGRDYATAIMRRHRLAERLLVDILRVPWHQVHEEAGRLEHAISPNLERHLVALLGDPGTCPHGNPIPGSANAVDPGPLLSLAAAPIAAAVIVRRIDEELEAQRQRMEELEKAGLMPGASVRVTGRDGNLVLIDGAAGPLRLDPKVAALVYVSPGDAAAPEQPLATAAG